MLEQLLEWDRRTFIYLNSLGIEAYDAFWSAITSLYSWIPLYLLFVALLLTKFPRREAVRRLLTLTGLVIFIGGFTYGTKIFVARLRPNNTEEMDMLIRILQCPTDYSFFSGHASSSFAITVLVFLFLRERVQGAFLFFLWPVLFSLSRIYVGVHFPLDVIVGTGVGVLSGLLFYGLYCRLSHPTQR